MKEKIGFYSSLLITGLLCLLFSDTLLWIAGVFHEIPGSHKEVLLMGFLLWFMVSMARQDRDDDWAGQL